MNVKTSDKIADCWKISYRYLHLNFRLWLHLVIFVSGILKSYTYDIQGQFLQWSEKDKRVKSITFKGHSEGQASNRMYNILKKKFNALTRNAKSLQN